MKKTAAILSAVVLGVSSVAFSETIALTVPNGSFENPTNTASGTGWSGSRIRSNWKYTSDNKNYFWYSYGTGKPDGNASIGLMNQYPYSYHGQSPDHITRLTSDAVWTVPSGASNVQISAGVYCTAMNHDAVGCFAILVNDQVVKEITWTSPAGGAWAQKTVTTDVGAAKPGDVIKVYIAQYQTADGPDYATTLFYDKVTASATYVSKPATKE